jgi:hypothetical protein
VFFLDLCIDITTRTTNANLPGKAAFYESILSSSLLFDQFSRNAGFRAYANQGGMSPGRQSFLFETLWGDLSAERDLFKEVLRVWHSGVTPVNLNPFMADNSYPNVLSYMHLVGQSMVQEHVCLSLTLLIVQAGLTYDMVEEALSLPKGYLTTFSEPKANAKSYLRTGWDKIVGQGS